MKNEDVSREIGLAICGDDFTTWAVEGIAEITAILDKHYLPLPVDLATLVEEGRAAKRHCDKVGAAALDKLCDALEALVRPGEAASMGVITADGRNYVVTVLGSEEAVKTLVAMTESRPAEGTWAWALERMKEGKWVRCLGWYQAARITVTSNRFIDGETGNVVAAVLDWFTRTDWRVVEAE